MTLPTIVTPTYKLIIPSTNKPIKYRPFLVKEEKLLLMAKETDSIVDNIETIKQIIENCILSNINVNNLSTFDIEYIFIQLRSKSVGNIIILNYEHDCPNNEDQKQIKFNVDLDKVTIENNNTNNPIIIVQLQWDDPDLRDDLTRIVRLLSFKNKNGKQYNLNSLYSFDLLT